MYKHATPRTATTEASAGIGHASAIFVPMFLILSAALVVI